MTAEEISVLNGIKDGLRQQRYDLYLQFEGIKRHEDWYEPMYYDINYLVVLIDILLQGETDV